jgi:hypothetical protein
MREAAQRLTTIRFKFGDHVRDRASGHTRDCRLRPERSRASPLSRRPLQRQPLRLSRRRSRRVEGAMRTFMIDFAMALVIVGAFSGAFWLFLHP